MTRYPNRRTLSLRARLGLITTVLVIEVVVLGFTLQILVFERDVERDLLETAEVTARTVADEVRLQEEPFDRDLLTRSLEAHVQLPPIRNVSVFFLAEPAQEWAATTALDISSQQRTLARTAYDRREMIWGERTGVLQVVALPIDRDDRPFGALAVTVSLLTAQELRSRGRLLMALFAAGATIVIVTLVDQLVRVFVHRPVANILDTMKRAGTGDLSSRATIARDDELGRVADGLNAFIARIGQFNQELQQRIDDATAELRQRNQALVDSHQRIFALREALARAEQVAAAGQTAANLAHHIGTPLNVVSAHLQMLIEEEAKHDTRRLARLRAAHGQVLRVTDVVRSTLDAVRKPTRAEEAVEPGPLMARTAEVVRPLLTASGVELALEIDPELPTIMADPVQLEVALLNLVSNSVDAMKGGGTLTVNARRAGAGLQLVVADTGAGIAPELLPRIFEPWVTTKAPGRGTGLGLSITRDVVIAHRGRIHVESTPDCGTVITIDLPAAANAVAGRPEEAPWQDS